MTQNLKTHVLLCTLTSCVITAALITPLSAGQAAAQAESVTRPTVSEQAAPLEVIAPIAQDGFRGQAILRKPPGDGPFPAVVLIHGGLTTLSTESLKRYVTTRPLPSRLLAAGYVVATITYRSRDVELQSRVSLDDSLAAVDHVQRLPYVDKASVGVFGCSGGGDLALAVASERPVAAIVAEEPATILFTGVFNNTIARAGERYTPMDSAPIFADPKKYHTEEYRQRTKQKISKIQSPILIVQGDVKTPLDVNAFNAAFVIPELRAAGKTLDVITYPGAHHCFAMMPGPPAAASALKAFRDSDEFFRKHLVTKPKPIDAALVTYVP
jgi:dipeptidyl aminopeptidase/acylaminoacyl peptidase